MLQNNFTINKDGNLAMDQVDTTVLAKEFGTPLYVVSRSYIEDSCKNYHRIMSSHFGTNYRVAYASKALSAKFIYRVLAGLDMDIDAVSGGEVYTAIAAGYPPERLHFNGGNKTEAEVSYALEMGVESFVIDNFHEIAMINRLAEKRGLRATVLLRVKPGVDAHTHEFISTGHTDSKFGFGIDDGSVFQAVEAILASPSLDFVGLHCHIGSQIFLAEPYGVAARVMTELMAVIKGQYSHTLTRLIIGGGFGVRYTEEDKPESAESMIAAAAESIKAVCKQHAFPVPQVGIEPGRSIVGPAGITLYTVGTVKEIKNVRNYVSVDGGMTDNPRFALYGAKYHTVVANKGGDKADYLATIVGKCCESGDIISRDVHIQKPDSGDILATFVTGAYNYSMASNYNKNPRPAMVMIDSGIAQLVIKGETYEDLIRLEI